MVDLSYKPISLPHSNLKENKTQRTVIMRLSDKLEIPNSAKSWGPWALAAPPWETRSKSADYHADHICILLYHSFVD